MPPMEGLGAAASILQVADIGFEVGIVLFKYAKKVAYAEKQLQELGDQVEANATCLKTVGALLDDPETRALHTAKLYDDTRAVSRGCKEVFYELNKTISKLDDGGSKLLVGARLQWPLYSRKLADLLKVLKNYSDVLHLMLAVLHIVEGRRAATSTELQALGKSLRRLSISNASLSKSNKNLVDMLYANQQAPEKTDIDHASQMFLTIQRSIDAPNGDPAVSTRVTNDPPKTSPVKNQKRRSTDSTHDHLQRCMDSVQELANTIACAMSAWQGQEKNGSSDIHGSHAKLIADISELPTDLECEMCRGRVSWSHFDLVKAASECLGTCTCVNRISSSHWRCCTYDSAETFKDSEPIWRETKPRRSRDAYSGRPRGSSMLENTRSGSSNPAPPRNGPTVIQGDFARASSPPRRSEPDYYIQPASSKESKATRQFEHKKLYSVDDGGAKLVADVDLGSGGERHHKRRESGDRLVHRSAGYDHGRKPYHASGKREKLLDDDNAFSYTDPASMCKDTEPRWRETRPRRGSVDRGGAIRDRPVSMIESHGVDPRRSTREVGPPPSQRGWDKIQDLGSSRRTRDPVPQSPSRSRDRDESRGRYNDSRDPYYIAPRKTSADRNRASVIHQNRPTERYDSEYDERTEPKRRERRMSATMHKDRSISRRGFGPRSDSEDRYGTRGSDESFERNSEVARDSAFADGHRNAPSESQYILYPQESKRKEYGRSYDDDDCDGDRDRPRRGNYDREEYRERHHHRRNSVRDDDKKDGDNSLSGALQIRPQPENNDRDSDRSHESPLHFREPPRFKDVPSADEQYRHRMQRIQHELGLPSFYNDGDLERVDPNRERRHRQRELRQAERKIREANSHQTDTGKPYVHDLPEVARADGSRVRPEHHTTPLSRQGTWSTAPSRETHGVRRCASILDSAVDPDLMAQVSEVDSLPEADVVSPAELEEVSLSKIHFETDGFESDPDSDSGISSQFAKLNFSERDEESEMTGKRRERRLSKRTSSRVFKRPHSQSPNSDTEATDTDVANDRSGDTSMKRLRRRVQGPAGEVIDNNTNNRREDHARVADLLPKDPSIERVPQLFSQSSPRSPGYTTVEEEQHVSWLPASPSRTAPAAEHPSLKRSHSQMLTGTGNVSSPLAPKLYDDDDDDDDEDEEVEDLSPKHSQFDRDEAMESSSALQALLSRWLGDNADAVLPETA